MTRLRSVDAKAALAVLGLIVLGVGIALVSLPAALAVVGGLLLVYAILPDQSAT